MDMYADNFKLVIIGNKIDLAKIRSVQYCDAESLAKVKKLLKYRVLAIQIFQL
jgi:hypothetical protein